jgi:outer membrane protein, multidrug efflux system
MKSSIRRMAVAAALAAVMLLPACAVGPDYVRPQVDTPKNWRTAYSGNADLADTAWWERFGDPVLTELIETALRNNIDVKIAATRVDQYLGVLQATSSQFFPQITGDLNAKTMRTSRSVYGSSPALPRDYDNYSAVLNASWEIDFWGRIRRLHESSRAQVLSGDESRRAVVLTLVSNVANSYITLRGLDKQLDIARSTEKAYAETLRIFRLRYKYGAVSRLELSQQEAQYETARQAVPDLESGIAQQENALSVLLGTLPGPIKRGKTIDELALPSIPAGLPSALLERRPDIKKAEQDLISANAQIGAAKAQYFPKITITGMLGTASSQLTNLFLGPAGTKSLAADIAGPLLTFGSVSGLVKQAEAAEQQAMHQYRLTIYTAFREVEDSLIISVKSREKLESTSRQVKALAQASRVSRLRYEAGLVDYLQVLDADRSYFSGQLSNVQQQAVVLSGVVNVYKTMGGGWVDKADRVTNTSPVDIKEETSGLKIKY